MLKSQFAYFGIVVSKQGGKVQVECEMNFEGQVFAYPVCSLQEEFREYAVIEMFKKSEYILNVLRPKRIE